MRVSDDVMELVELLNEEGFGALAGDLLMEISLGRELEEGPEDTDDVQGQPAETFAEDTAIVRVPFNEEEQLEAAMTFLQFRLVEPVKRMAEAERIAGRLAAAPAQPVAASDGPGKPLRITFRARDDAAVRFERAEAPGDATSAEELQAALRRFIDQAV